MDLNNLIEPAIAGLILITTIGLARLFKRAIAREIRTSLEAVIKDLLVDALSELLPNDGKSLNDRVRRIEQSIAQLIERPSQ